MTVKNFYVNAAVIPSSGHLYQEQHERMNTESFQGFLDRLSCAWADMDVVLVLDRAGWHRAKRLVWPDNIQPFFLPPYSPELNPSERLWLRSKAEVIKNKIFDEINLQKSRITDWFASQNTETIQKLCACHYLV